MTNSSICFIWVNSALVAEGSPALREFSWGVCLRPGETVLAQLTLFGRAGDFPVELALEAERDVSWKAPWRRVLDRERRR